MPLNQEKAKAIKRRYDALKTERGTIESLWQLLADYALPFYNITRQGEPNISYAERLYDSTVEQANFVCASGTVTNTSPANDRWFAFEAPAVLRARFGGASVADEWFQQCTEIVMREIALSNFYSEIQSAHQERGLFGICNLFTDEGEDTLLHFEAITVGTYCIAKSSKGRVDTVYREFKLSARQAAQEFGEDNLGPKLKGCLKSPDPQAKDKLFCFIHAVYPRSDSERDPYRRTPDNKPWASCTVCVDDDYLVRESGYDEMPYAVSRWVTWPGQVWGWSPGLRVLPIVRQVNFNEKQLDLLVEKAVDPRVLVPQSLNGLVDFRAGGLTPFDENNPGGKPEEWLTGGRYDVGEDRSAQKRQVIEKAFHNDLFQMFAGLERDITAYQAAQMAGEKLDVFIPIFQRITTELLGPTLTRCFGLCYRAGYLPPPPAEVMVPTSQGVGIALPSVAYHSKMALAIKSLENRAADSFIQRMALLVQAKPELMDWLNDDAFVPDSARNEGLPARWIRSQEQVDEMRAARAEAQAAQQQAMLAESVTKSAANMGSAPPALQQAAERVIDV